MVFHQESIDAPDARDVLYVAHVTKACPCGWKNDSSCFVPPGVCDTVNAQQDAHRWKVLCSAGTYTSSSDIMFVRSVLQSSRVNLPACREYNPSTVWGLLDSTQQYNWYNGQSEQWNVSLQEIAAFGHGGVRLSDLLSSSLLQAPAKSARVATITTPPMRRQLLCGFMRTPLSPVGQAASGPLTLSVLPGYCGHIPTMHRAVSATRAQMLFIKMAMTV